MSFLIILILALISASVFADAPNVPTRIETAPVIDGNLDEPEWNQALVITDFLQRYPVEGSAPSEKTEVKLLYTTQSLYIAFIAEDRFAKQISATVLRRDDFEIVNNDQFAMAIDSYNDGRNGYWFSTNPLGTRVDSQFFEEGNNWEPNWNGIWNCKSKIVPGKGWIAEIEIPFSTLRFKRSEVNVMGINFFRRIIRTNEQLFAPLIPLQYSNGTPNVSVARKYIFHNIAGGHPWFIKPHVVTGFNKNSVSNSTDHDGGLDVRYALTDSLRTNFSLNTDFAEAEVDDRQINLSRFALFFPEKRDFFLENAGSFQFGLPGETEIFFSRRIGLMDTGDTVPILFGGKLTGKLRGLELGFLNVQTNDTDQTPDENFTVFRMKSAVGNRSYIGGIFTSRWNGPENFKDSFGFDMNLYLKNEIALSTFLSGTNDPENLHSWDDRSAAYIALGRGGERTSFHIGFTKIGSSFDPAIGFVVRTGIRRYDGSLSVPFYFNSNRLRSVTPGLQLNSTEDLPGQFTDQFQHASLKFVFSSEDELTLLAEHSAETIPEPFPIFRDLFISTGKYENRSAGINFVTKPGRSLSAGLLTSSGDFYDGKRTHVEPSLQWKINRHFTLAQLVALDRIHIPDDRFTIQLFRTRIAYSLNTHLSIASLIQYDNSSQQIGVNIRFNYLFREGTELFIVYDEIADDRIVPRIEKKNNKRLLMKFTYLFDL